MASRPEREAISGPLTSVTRASRGYLRTTGPAGKAARQPGRPDPGVRHRAGPQDRRHRRASGGAGLWLPTTPYRQVIRVLQTCSKASRWSMIASRVPALRVPSRRPDARVAAAVRASAGVEGRRDPSAAPPAVGPAAADGGEAEADVDRPGAVRRTAHAHPALTPRRAALVHHPWHDPALAPRYRPPPLGRQIQTEAAGRHRPTAASSAWCCAWRPTTSVGGTGRSPVSWPGSASPSHPRRSGRS